MPPNHILRKYTTGYKLSKSLEKINRRMNDIRLLEKNEKRIGNSDTHCQNIQLEHRDGIWHRKMRLASNENRKTTHYGRNGTTKSRKN